MADLHHLSTEGGNEVFAQQKPNIVIFLSDDQGWDDLGVSGNTNLRTPNIDSLARDGVTLDRFYVCAVCSPTRAEFLTGRYHTRMGVRGTSSGKERFNTDERTIAEAFRAAGYATGAFGKWHSGSQWPYHPNARGFDEFYGFTSGHWAAYFDPPLERNGNPTHGRGFIADDLTVHALAFIEQNRERPFFCYIPFNTPHGPLSVPDEYWDRFKDAPIALRGEEGDKERADVTRAALALCENIDWNVGRVLRRLDELQLADNTIVIYFSDNGPASFRWNGRMKGKKGSVDEGGVRSPFFMRWPGKIPAGTTVREVAGAIDLLPTLASMAGVTPAGTKPLDGIDISPLLLGPTRHWSDRMIFSHQNGRVSVRTRQYRLDERGALFDMASDPGQRTDVSRNHPELTMQLSKSVASWRAEMPPGRDDNRPFPVGYAEFPMTPLPARDGVPQGGIQRSNRFPNSSYFTNWTTPDDSITWDIEVNASGSYEAVVHYTCAAGDVGSTIELGFNGSTLQGKVAPAWDPPFLDQKDRVPRDNGPMKEFCPLTLGRIHLEKGRGPLTLRATHIAGRQVMDVRLITLTLLANHEDGPLDRRLSTMDRTAATASDGGPAGPSAGSGHRDVPAHPVRVRSEIVASVNAPDRYNQKP